MLEVQPDKITPPVEGENINIFKKRSFERLPNNIKLQLEKLVNKCKLPIIKEVVLEFDVKRFIKEATDHIRELEKKLFEEEKKLDEKFKNFLSICQELDLQVVMKRDGKIVLVKGFAPTLNAVKIIKKGMEYKVINRDSIPYRVTSLEITASLKISGEKFIIEPLSVFARTIDRHPNISNSGINDLGQVCLGDGNVINKRIEVKDWRSIASLILEPITYVLTHPCIDNPYYNPHFEEGDLSEEGEPLGQEWSVEKNDNALDIENTVINLGEESTFINSEEESMEGN